MSHRHPQLLRGQSETSQAVQLSPKWWERERALQKMLSHPGHQVLERQTSPSADFLRRHMDDAFTSMHKLSGDGSTIQTHWITGIFFLTYTFFS